jgi:hypothetical protein
MNKRGTEEEWEENGNENENENGKVVRRKRAREGKEGRGREGGNITVIVNN